MALHDELVAHVSAVEGTVKRSSAIIEEIAAVLAKSFAGGGKLLICGNGGSAADAQHLAAEFMNRMRRDRRPWPAVALTTDSSVLTSITNDAIYDDVFARQVEALGRPGDVLIALSTSGASENVLNALRQAAQQDVVTIGFTGEGGSRTMEPLCDLLLVVPSTDTPRVQEAHEFVYHVVAGLVDDHLLG